MSRESLEALYKEMAGGDTSTETPHRHRCSRCGCVWHHDPNKITDMSAAHVCPRCDHASFFNSFIYDGDEETDYIAHEGQSRQRSPEEMYLN